MVLVLTFGVVLLITVGLSGLAARSVLSMWPRTVIATAALQVIPGGDASRGRKPEIMADAAHVIFNRDARSCTGNFFIDEDVLREAGITDLDRYAAGDGEPLPDIFLD